MSSSYQAGKTSLLEFLLCLCIFTASRCGFQHVTAHSTTMETRLETTQLFSIELRRERIVLIDSGKLGMSHFQALLKL